jgi:hypothetical protein
MFTCELWILNDLYEDLPGGTVRAFLSCAGADEETEVFAWAYPGVPQNQNVQGPTMNCLLPNWDGNWFTLHLRVDGKEEMASRYHLALA